MGFPELSNSGCPPAEPGVSVCTGEPSHRLAGQQDRGGWTVSHYPHPWGAFETGNGVTLLSEGRHARLHIDSNDLPGLKLPGQDALRQRIFQLLLNCPLQRPRAVYRVEAG